MKSRSDYLAEITGKSPIFVSVVLACMFMATGRWVAAQAPADTNWKPVEDARGRPGQVPSADVIRFGMPRRDLHVTLGDVTVKAGLALGSWAAFMRTGDGAMVTEANPAMKALRDNGIQVTALHSHMLTEERRLFFMHFRANDDAAKLARGLKAVDQTNSKE